METITGWPIKEYYQSHPGDGYVGLPPQSSIIRIMDVPTTQMRIPSDFEVFWTKECAREEKRKLILKQQYIRYKLLSWFKLVQKG
jgi:hypothetical protein